MEETTPDTNLKTTKITALQLFTVTQLIMNFHVLTETKRSSYILSVKVTLSQFNAIHIITDCSSRIHFNTIFPATLQMTVERGCVS